METLLIVMLLERQETAIFSHLRLKASVLPVPLLCQEAWVRLALRLLNKAAPTSLFFLH
jgi:hypothetical protein